MTIKQKTALTAAFCLIIGAVPLVVAVVVVDDKLEGLGLGFVVTAGWVLLLAVSVQISRARRERQRAQEFPGPAGRRHDARSVAEAMVALAPPDWTGLRLEVDDAGRRITVTHAGGVRESIADRSPALDAAIDQLDASTGRSRTPQHRLILAASRDGTARVTVE